MSTTTKSTSTTTPPAAPPAKPPRKSVVVLKLLGRSKGATIEEMAEPAGWQPHSTRAFLSGLRKKGMTIAREPRKTGETAYRIVTAGDAAATEPAALKVAAEDTAPATGKTDAAVGSAAAVATEATA